MKEIPEACVVGSSFGLSDLAAELHAFHKVQSSAFCIKEFKSKVIFSYCWGEVQNRI